MDHWDAEADPPSGRPKEPTGGESRARGDDTVRETAWELYARHLDVFVLALRRVTLGGVADGMDVIHDFVTDALPSALRRYRPDDGSVRGWLYVVFLRFARRRARQMARSEWLLSSPADAPESPGAAGSAVTSTQWESVLDALSKLPAERRNALRAFFGTKTGGGSIREVAGQLACSRSKAKRLVAEGLAAVACLVDGQELFDEMECRVLRARLVDDRAWWDVASELGIGAPRARVIARGALGKLAGVMRTESRPGEHGDSHEGPL